MKNSIILLGIFTLFILTGCSDTDKLAKTLDETIKSSERTDVEISISPWGNTVTFKCYNLTDKNKQTEIK